jgi:hypothetical protein
MGQLGDDGGGGIHELAESTGDVHGDGGIHGPGGVPRRRQRPNPSTDGGGDGSGVQMYQQNPRTAGGRGVAATSTGSVWQLRRPDGAALAPATPTKGERLGRRRASAEWEAVEGGGVVAVCRGCGLAC